MFTTMLRSRWKEATCRIVRSHWQNIKTNRNVEPGVHLSTSAGAGAVHLPTTIGSASTNGKAGSSIAAAFQCQCTCLRTGFGVKKGTAAGIRNDVLAMQFSSSSQHNKRKDYDWGDDHAIDRHFNNNPLKKHMDHYDNQEKSLEEIAREQKRKMKSVKRARAAKDFKQGPEKRSLSWDTIQQIHYLRQENPDEWSIASLAESFNVSEEVIAKVLRSKFRPSVKARQKQDRIAAENSGYVSGGASDLHVLVASGPAGRPSQNEGKESKHVGTHNGTQGFVQEKMTRSNAAHNKSTVLKSSPSSSENTEQYSIKMENKDGHTPFSSSEKEKSEEELKSPELEFTIGDVDFENVDKLMGQVKLKPGQVFRKGRNFYNEHGEFLYRI